MNEVMVVPLMNEGRKKREWTGEKREWTGKKAGILSALQISIAPKKTSSPNNAFSTLWMEEEFRLLQQWSIPPEVLYEGVGWEMLTEMDKDTLFIYTNRVNLGLQQIAKMLMSSELLHYPNAKNILAQLSEWVDIGTGNGIVTNNVATRIYNAVVRAKMEYGFPLLLEKMLSCSSGEEYEEAVRTFDNNRIKLTSCDLSHTSLEKAKNLESADPELGELFDLEYVPEKFQQVLEKSEGKENHRLITMFNFLANFEEADLKAILWEVYQAMTKKDMFIPSFFQCEKGFDVVEHGTRTSFGRGSLELYNNVETKHWITESFYERYHPNRASKFSVQWRKGEKGQPYIEVALLFPEEVEFGTDTAIISGKDLPKAENGMVKLTAFKSYRMSKEYLTKLLEKIWFGIDGRLETDNRLQVAPVLYKK